MTTIRQMEASELGRIAEIDRSEDINQQYRSRGATLELVNVAIRAPRWGQPGENSVQHYIDVWQPIIVAGGVLLGAFDGGRLVGMAIYEPPGARLSEGVANLAVLHVTRAYRGRGVGGALADEVVRLARADGAQRLYVSAIPTRTTVDFYVRQGFEPLATPDQGMFALEPNDIHLERKL
jgi:GNAT superfamily N-acetyltransferase